MSREMGEKIFMSHLKTVRGKLNPWEQPNLANAALRALVDGDLSLEEKRGVRSAVRALAQQQAQDHKLVVDLKRIVANSGKSGHKWFNLNNVAFLLEEDSLE